MKPHVNKHHKKPIGTRRLIQLLTQHLYDTGLTTAFVNPPFTAEEEAEARSLAVSIEAQLHAPDRYSSGRTDQEASIMASRVAALASVKLYQIKVDAVLRVLKTAPVAFEIGDCLNEYDAAKGVI